MRILCLSTTLLIACVCACGRAEAPAPIPTAAGHAQRVVIVSIDGGRPDVILRAKAPNLRALMKDGSFSFWARTTEVSVTLPSHASMITGCTPEKHGINFNKDVPEDELVYPKVPTIFELAKKRGLSTAMASGKSKFVALCKPGSIDYPLVPQAKQSFNDTQVADNASKAIIQHQPQVMLVHFAGGDKIGHATLRVGAAMLMGNDVRPGDYARPQGCAIALGISDLAAAKRMFDALADGGVITLPLAETFWALAFGAVVDRFGVTWEINCERPGRRRAPGRGRKSTPRAARRRSA